MADLRFFNRAGPFTLGDIVQTIGGDLVEAGEADRTVTDVMALDDAGEGHLSFIDNRKYLDAYRRTEATNVATSRYWCCLSSAIRLSILAASVGGGDSDRACWHEASASAHCSS